MPSSPRSVLATSQIVSRRDNDASQACSTSCVGYWGSHLQVPDVIRGFAQALIVGGAEVHVITDMHDRADVLAQLTDNGFGFIAPRRVHCADYTTHGEGCKAELLASLSIDMILDDFVGYVAIPGCPLRCLVMPDATKPYWHPTWKAGKAGESDFGRRVYTGNVVSTPIASAAKSRRRRARS